MSFLVRPSRLAHEGAMAYRWRLAQANGLSLRDAETYFDCTDPMLLNDASGWQGCFHQHWYRYCACCLQRGESIGHIGWEILFADACPQCGYWLIDTCECCKVPLIWHRQEQFRCNCGHAFVSSCASRAPEALVRLSRTLENLALGKTAAELPVVAHLMLEELVRLIRLLGSYGTSEGARMPQKILQAGRLDVSWRVTTYAAEVLDRWPEGFHRLLDHLWRLSPEEKRGRLIGAFRGFYTALYRSFASASFDWLRMAFENYLAEHWTGAIGRRNRRLTEHALRRMHWIPVSAAAKARGISTAKLNALIDAGNIICEERITASGRRFRVVRQQELTDLPLPAKDELTLEQAAQALGLKRQRLSRLLLSLCPGASKTALHGTPWRIPTV